MRKQQRLSPKFYLFDCGVKRALDLTLDIRLKEGTYEYGRAFEHFLIAEIYRLNSYLRKKYKLSYLQTKQGQEIDLVVERPDKKVFLLEIKAA